MRTDPAGVSRKTPRRSSRALGDGFRTVDVVVTALANLGGDTVPVDIEDVAIEAHRLMPHRFSWRRHPEQVDMAGVRDGLSDARKPENGSLVVGDRKHGWTLTPAGVELAGRLSGSIGQANAHPRVRLDVQVRAAERARVLRSPALLKAQAGRLAEVSAQEVRDLLRIDAYVSEEKYQQRASIVMNAFADEPEIQSVISQLERRLREGGSAR